jgi:hypothetical protein
MIDSSLSDTGPLGPEPVTIPIRWAGKHRNVSYEQAFVLACTLLERGEMESAARLFERLETYTDRGPRAAVMHAFCEAAALHFDSCSKPLISAFDTKKSIAGDLHNAFVSYHVGIRQDALSAMAELVNQHRDLPTLCLLLGNMFQAGGEIAMARKCWSMAIKRDYPNGAVALAADRKLRSTEGPNRSSRTA